MVEKPATVARAGTTTPARSGWLAAIIGLYEARKKVELLGAAAFITSCVVGSMCIIKPFKVVRGQFLRDVGFFTVAVTLLLVVLWDSKLEAWEAAAMIVLYAVYVTTVVVGSWWRKRQEQRRKRHR